jgi:DNA-binding MarR family transcriptional regulator
MLPSLFWRRGSIWMTTQLAQPVPPATTADDVVRALEETIPRYLRGLRSTIERAEGPDRLTIAQVRCLQAIAASPDGETLTSRLARQISVSAPSISSMIDSLVGRSLVVRHPNPENRRQVRLLITDEGRTLLARYEGLISDHIRSLLAPLNSRSKRRMLLAMTDLAALIDSHELADDQRLEE